MTARQEQPYNILTDAWRIAKTEQQRREFYQSPHMHEIAAFVDRSPLRNAEAFIAAAKKVGEKVAARYATQDPLHPVLAMEEDQQIEFERIQTPEGPFEEPNYQKTTFTRYESIPALGTPYKSPYAFGQHIYISQENGDMITDTHGEMYLFEGDNRGKGISTFKISQYTVDVRDEYPGSIWTVEFKLGAKGTIGFEFDHYGDGATVKPIGIAWYPGRSDDVPTAADLEVVMKELGMMG